MMIKKNSDRAFAILKIPIYYNPLGKRTCMRSKDSICEFLRTRRFGTMLYCGLTDKEVMDGEGGYLDPTEDCPLGKVGGYVTG